MSRQSTSWRRRVLAAMYRAESGAISNADRQHWYFCRQIVCMALAGWRDPWVAAHYYTYGLHPDKYRDALAAREARQLWELHQPRKAEPDRYRSNKSAA